MSWLSDAVNDFVKLIEGNAPQVAADLTNAAAAAEAALQPTIDAKVTAVLDGIPLVGEAIAPAGVQLVNAIISALEAKLPAPASEPA